MKFYQKVSLGTAGTAAGAGALAWKTMAPWIEHDFKLMNAGYRLMQVREDALTSMLIDKFEKHVEKQPKKTFLIFEDNYFSYEFVDQMACKVANIAKSWGLVPGDCVAMMIQNEPAFVWTFLGLQKLGITCALINYNLKSHPLVHCVNAAEPKYFIVGSGEALLDAVVEILDDLASKNVFVQGLGARPPPSGIQSFDPLFVHALPTPVSPMVRQNVTMDDTCCYIYTSGTTGNPKPVFISQAKAQGIGTCMFMVELNDNDMIYTVLPLYHSAGGGIGLYGTILTDLDLGFPKPAYIKHHQKACINCCVTQCVAMNSKDKLYMVLPLYHSAGGATGMFSVIYLGATMVLRRKFSASHFWEDCRRHKVTVIQYIGELFRYLVAQPPNELDKVHNVRAAFGNGLRKDIWEEVNKRFKIPQIAEFFGATEGVTLLLNLSNKPGAIGRLSPLLEVLDPDHKVLVKFDYGTAQPIRDKNGRCIKVGIGEPGLFLSKVPEYMLEKGDFEVYRSSKESNKKKLVRNAFEEGDVYFNYGDVFVLDEEYFLYFKDRIGDTFRWKGENVSTTEVANVIAALDFLHDANVYGVTIPGHDGRAGMAALTLNQGKTLGQKELRELYDHVCEELPSYARPLFIRNLSAEIMTGTFKQRKVELVEEGYDHNKVKDDLYFLDTENKTYSPFFPKDVTRFLQSKI